MNKLSTLAVARNNDLGRRAPANSLVDQVEHGCSTSGVSSSKESDDVGRVSDTLNGQATGSTQTASQSIEESRAFAVSGADITILCSTTSVDDSDSTAGSPVSQLVVGVSAILALGKGGCNFLRNIAGLKLLSVLLDGETSVNDIRDREADTLTSGDRCWSSECSTKKGSNWEDSLDLHLEQSLRM